MTADGARDRRRSPAERCWTRIASRIMPGAGASRSIARHRPCALADGRDLPYDKLLLATGARPRRLPIAGVERSARSLSAHLRRRAGHSRRTSRRATASPSSAAASSASSSPRARSQRGASVTVIEAQPRILMRGVPAEIAELVAAAPRARPASTSCAGTASRASRRPTAPGARRARRRRRDRGRSRDHRHRRRAGDRSLPQTAGLADRQRHRGRWPSCAPAIPDIFAAGDCCSFPLAALWRPPRAARSLAQRAGAGRAWPRATCSAPARPMPRCRGSGPISMTSACRSPALPTRAATTVGARSRRRRLHPLPSRRRRPAGRGERHRPAAMPSPGTSGWPRC